MGSTPVCESVFTDHAKKLIEIKARQLCRRHQFSLSEQDDIQQELWLHLAAKAHHFDPTRGSLQTFVERVICSGVCVLLRRRRRQRRRPWFRALSLESTTVEIDGPPTQIGLAICKEDVHRRQGAASRDDAARHDDAAALDHAVRSMSPELRSLCQRLSKTSVCSAARQANLSRRQVRNAIGLIRQHLERAGF